jgi:Derlin-2/3
MPLRAWYLTIPPVTRTYVTIAVCMTGACSLELVSPFKLYFSWRLVFFKFQLWRVITNFLFFGSLGILPHFRVHTIP